MAKRALVVRFSSLGDLVLTTGPLHHLKKNYPGVEFDFLTSDIGEEIFINSIEFDNIYRVPKGSGILDLTRIYTQLPRYDIVLDLQNNFKSHFLKWFVRGKYFRIIKHSKERRAFVKNRSYREVLNQHVVEKYYKVFRQAFELPDLDVEELRPRFHAQKITIDEKSFNLSEAVVIHPYASQKNKEWPYVADLVDQLILSETPVIIVGSSDVEVTLPESDLILNLTNKTSIREMASFLSQAKGLITTDSGPMHLGIAVNTPTLAIFGPTTKEFGFYPVFNRTEVVEIEDLECRPCHVHGGDICPKEHHNCVTQISVESVLEAFKKVAPGPFKF